MGAGIQGIIALAVGVYIMPRPEGASDVIRFLIALVLLLDSLGHIVDGFRSRDLSSSPWETLRGGIGATVAVLTLLSAGSNYVADDGARQMLAIGLLAYGVLGIVSLIFTFRSTGFNDAAIIADVLAIVLGILLLSARSGDTGGTLLGAAAARGRYRAAGLLLVPAGQTGRDAPPTAQRRRPPLDRDAVAGAARGSGGRG